MTAAPRNLFHELLSRLQSRPDLSCILLSTEESLAYALHTLEKEVLSGKELPTRRAEFISGRAAANRAMRQLGFQMPGPVGRGPLGEPVWPEGIVGSITHSHPWTIAVVGRSADVAMLGIDLENISKLREQDISEEICTPTELAWVHMQSYPSIALGRIFSGKEAFYKALSPRCQRRFDFKDVRLSWMPGKDCFLAELLIDLGKQYARGFQIEVRSHSGGDWVFAYVIENAK